MPASESPRTGVSLAHSSAGKIAQLAESAAFTSVGHRLHGGLRAVALH